METITRKLDERSWTVPVALVWTPTTLIVLISFVLYGLFSARMPCDVRYGSHGMFVASAATGAACSGMAFRGPMMLRAATGLLPRRSAVASHGGSSGWSSCVTAEAQVHATGSAPLRSARLVQHSQRAPVHIGGRPLGRAAHVFLSPPNQLSQQRHQGAPARRLQSIPLGWSFLVAAPLDDPDASRRSSRS